MTTHTPGPWTAVQDGNKVDWYIVDEGENVIVFGLSEPDARLSAAAPDLLAALKAITDYMAYAEALGEDKAVFKNARDAIAKAEGGES